MAGRVDIANLALSLIGSKARVAAFDEQSTEAHHIRLHYDVAIRSLLEARDWGFAEKVATLALTTDTPPGDLEYAYALPNDCLSPRWLNHDRGVVDPPDYRLGYNGTQRVLYTNEEDAELVYTAGIENDPTVYSPLFVDAAAAALAVRICMPVTGDRAMRAEMRAAAADAISVAAAANLNAEANNDTGVEAEWIEDRA